MRVVEYLRAIWWILKYGPEVISIYDPLTKLFNRQIFDELISKEIAWAERYNEPFCLMVADIDDLKWVNDNLGHEKGDELILKVAKALIKGCRKADLISRYGGDEFLVCLPKADKENAEKVRERLKKEISSKSDFSFSFGFSVWKKGKTLKRMKQEADTEMYRHKKKKK
jgi:diguanylate cyclase (GGDEF)-like protein